MKQYKFKHNPNSEYYKRAKRQIDELRINLDFLIDMKVCYELRNDKALGMKYEQALDKIQQKYNILPSAWPVLIKYVSQKDNTLPNYNLIESPIKIFTDKNRVFLEITPNTTEAELQYFAIKHYASDIKPLLSKLNTKSIVTRVRNRDIKSQNKIYWLYDTGNKPTAIASKTGLSLEKVKSTLARRKKRVY